MHLEMVRPCWQLRALLTNEWKLSQWWHKRCHSYPAINAWHASGLGRSSMLLVNKKNEQWEDGLISVSHILHRSRQVEKTKQKTPLGGNTKMCPPLNIDRSNNVCSKMFKRICHLRKSCQSDSLSKFNNSKKCSKAQPRHSCFIKLPRVDSDDHGVICCTFFEKNFQT